MLAQQRQGEKNKKLPAVVFGLWYAELSSVRGSWLQVYVSYVFELPEVEGKLFHGKAEMERVVF